MKSFFEAYTDDVLNGIKTSVVLIGDGQQITMEEGMRLWSEKAKEIRDEKNGLLFFCGNGASETMAEHMSHDWFQNAQINTTTCSETAHITAISNDLSYEEVFSYRIRRILSDKDMLITISSSGNSPNIVKAQQAGKEKGAFLVTLSGMKPYNRSVCIGNLNFYVPLETYGMVESAHSLILHGALDLFLETYMGGKH